VDLCGHATLASAFVVFEYWTVPRSWFAFNPQRRNCECAGTAASLTMDFPARRRTLRPFALRSPHALASRLGNWVRRATTWRSHDSEDEVRALVRHAGAGRRWIGSPSS